MCDILLIYFLCVYMYVCVQWMEVGASGVNGRHAEPTAPCGGAGNVPNLHPARVGKNARGWISNLSTAPVSSAHRVSTTISVISLINRLKQRLPLLITKCDVKPGMHQ